eukprot:UN03636
MPTHECTGVKMPWFLYIFGIFGVSALSSFTVAGRFLGGQKKYMIFEITQNVALVYTISSYFMQWYYDISRFVHCVQETSGWNMYLNYVTILMNSGNYKFGGMVLVTLIHKNLYQSIYTERPPTPIPEEKLIRPEDKYELFEHFSLKDKLLYMFYLFVCFIFGMTLIPIVT